MDFVTFLLLVFVAFIIGTVAEKFSPFSMPGGWAGAIVAGLLGAWIGSEFFGSWGPSLAGFSIVPAIVGASIVIVILGAIKKIFDRS